MAYCPPYELNDEMVKQIAEISALAERARWFSPLEDSLTLRRKNRIQSVYSSLAIEANLLSEDQVTAVLGGTRVLAPPKDILEVRNAYTAYDQMASFDPYSLDDLCSAHQIMMQGLTPEAGAFRTGPVGVVKNGEVIHFGTLPAYVPDNMAQLFRWLKESDAHMLVKSCIFHYEFEVIHPFADGNGRTGRLWHTLLLSHWQPLFAWIPVESLIFRHQEEYYDAINRSNAAGNGTAFLSFMLGVIWESLQEVQTVPADMPDKLRERWATLEPVLQQEGRLTNHRVRALCAVSSATANRILQDLCDAGLVQKHGTGKGTYYQ